MTRPAAPGIGERVRFVRKAAGLTLAGLADRMATDIGTIARIERGEHGCSLEFLYRIAVAVACRPCDLDPRLTHQLGDVMAPPPDENSPTVR